MDFKEIKEKCVSGETVLVDEYGKERCFIGFSPCSTRIITYSPSAASDTWTEQGVKNWKIKQDEKDLYYIWNVKDKDGRWFVASYRMNKYGCLHNGHKSPYADHERTICKVFPPIDKDGNEVEL